MKKVFLFIVAALMVAGVSSCSKSDDDEDDSNDFSLVGKEFVSEGYIGSFLDTECSEHFLFSTNSSGTYWIADTKTNGEVYKNRVHDFNYSVIYPNMKLSKNYGEYDNYVFSNKKSFYRTKDNHIFHLK